MTRDNETLYFHFYKFLPGSVTMPLNCGDILYLVLVTTLLQIFHRMCGWKNLENSANIWWRYRKS